MKKAKPVFLITANEFEEFLKKDRCVSRTVSEITQGKGKPVAEKLAGRIKNRLKELSSSDATWFECFCVEVQEGDGMSWSAEAVRKDAAPPHYVHWNLSGDGNHDNLPIISRCIGNRIFKKMAAKEKLITPFYSLTSWAPRLRGIGTVVAGVIILLIQLIIKEQFQKLSFSNLSPLWDINNLLVATGLALLIFFLSPLIKWGDTKDAKSGSTDNFHKQLEDSRIQKPKEYLQFIERIATSLQTNPFPRFVTIDDFDKLDPTTQKVILLYFKKYSENHSGSEFWVIFENSSRKPFSAIFEDNQNSYGFKNTKSFQQLLLNMEEKRKLVNLTGRPEQATEYTTVKSICENIKPGISRISNILKDYRGTHSKSKEKYNELDLLMLLSLNAIPHNNIPIPTKIITNEFPVRHRLRHEVLKEVLYGNDSFRLEEFRSGLSNIQKYFPTCLIMNDSSNPEEPTIRITVETKKAFEADYKALDLPKMKLGHVFWTLFWYDKKENSPIQAFWVRKLAEHLLESEAFLIDNRTVFVSVIHRLFDVCLFLVEGCLETCQFDKIINILRKAIHLLQENEFEKTPDRFRRLIRKLWESYAVLGDEQILTMILELYSELEKPKDTAPDWENILDPFFFETISLNSINRKQIKPEFLRWRIGDLLTSESVKNYARARSSWLSLMINAITPSLSHIKTLGLFQIARDSYDIIKELTEKALKGISDSIADRRESALAPVDDSLTVTDTKLRLIDLSTLSLSLWCIALRYHPSIIDSKISTLLSQLHNGDNISDNLVIDQFDTLINFCQHSVLIAGDLKNGKIGTLDAPLGIDFLMNGLIREICTISLSSLIMAYKYLPEDFREDFILKGIPAINEIFAECGTLLDWNPPTITSPNDLLSPKVVNEIDKLMSLTSLIWKRFSLERLEHFMNIRRLQFSAHVNNLPPYELAPLLKSISPIIDDSDYAGLMANIVISDCVRESKELFSYYYYYGGRMVLNGNFGGRFQDELSLLVILSCSDQDCTIFFNEVLEESKGETILNKFIKGWDEDNISSFLLKLFNAVKNINKKDIDLNKLKNNLYNSVSLIQSETIRVEAKSIMDVFSLEEDISSGKKINYAKLLGEWSNRKELAAYPWVIDLLLHDGYSDDSFIKECGYILDRDPGNDSYNSFFLLALTLANKLAGNNKNEVEFQVAIKYLKKSVYNWTNRNPVEINLKTFKLLHNYDNSGDYFQDILNWELIKLQRDHLEVFPQFIKTGRFFLIFQEYFDSMQFWGLRTEIEYNEFINKMNINFKSKKAFASEWKKQGHYLPDPFCGPKNEFISSEFLRIGYILFSPPIAQDQTFESDRITFNKIANKALPQLLDMIYNLKGLRGEVKEILQYFQNRFLNYEIN